MSASAIGLLLAVAVVLSIAVVGASTAPTTIRTDLRSSRGEGGLVSPLAQTSMQSPLSPSPGYDDASEFMAGDGGGATLLVLRPRPPHGRAGGGGEQNLRRGYRGLTS